MKLPNSVSAVIEQRKIQEYLLNAAHPDNRGKAAFFLSFGFNAEDWPTLAQALMRVAITADVAKKVETPHGSKYLIDGRIETPRGARPMVRTVWTIDRGANAPRLVTAYPGEE